MTTSEVVQRTGTKHALFPDMHLEPWTAPVLADAAQAAALTAAWAQHRFTKEELTEDVYVGADGTPTMRIDSYVEEAILEVARDHHVNVLSEEVGFVDVSSARTLIVDPLDGSANAAAGVGISSFSGVLVAEGSIDVFADPGSDTHRLVDLYAAMLLLPQAGGTVIDAFDRPIELSTDLTLRWSCIIGATPEIAEEVRDIIHARMVD